MGSTGRNLDYHDGDDGAFDDPIFFAGDSGLWDQETEMLPIFYSEGKKTGRITFTDRRLRDAWGNPLGGIAEDFNTFIDYVADIKRPIILFRMD